MKDKYDKKGRPLEVGGIKYHTNRPHEWTRDRDKKRLNEKYPKIDDWI